MGSVSRRAGFPHVRQVVLTHSSESASGHAPPGLESTSRAGWMLDDAAIGPPARDDTRAARATECAPSPHFPVLTAQQPVNRPVLSPSVHWRSISEALRATST